MIWIDKNLEQLIKENFKGRHLYSYLKKGVWQRNRYIQFRTPIDDDSVHYEVYEGTIQLHFEHEDYDRAYGNLIDYLMESTESVPEYEWSAWHNGDWFRCKFIGEIPDGEIESSISDFAGKFDELIKMYNSQNQSGPETRIEIAANPPRLAERVELFHMKLQDVLALPLHIPDYQRSYCWEESNVNCLLDDISEHIENGIASPYRLGCIILHSHDGIFDIIDGQQRLVTLAILCSELNVDSPLLDEKFDSSESVSYIAYNKSLIRRFCQRLRRNRSSFSKSVLSNIEFSVLILQNSSLDLAYTFFSHQNSRGVGLTDYDLLKAHHLRYIPNMFGKQAYRAAETWNKMIGKGHRAASSSAAGRNDVPDYVTVMDHYLYNLRKWMRHYSGGDDGTPHRIKHEYEAAPIIEEIPPFGEHFYFIEPIQGGTHFFEWVQRHIALYDAIADHRIMHELRKAFVYGSDSHYRIVLEALVFGYYLKFGTAYITEAFLCFLRIITDHRYKNKRVTMASVLEYVSHLNLIQLIDEATSPTFVLAECCEIAKRLSYPRRKDMRPIQSSMRRKAEQISRNLYGFIMVESFKTLNA